VVASAWSRSQMVWISSAYRCRLALPLTDRHPKPFTIPAIRGTEIERQGSTHCGRSLPSRAMPAHAPKPTFTASGPNRRVGWRTDLTSGTIVINNFARQFRMIDFREGPHSMRYSNGTKIALILYLPRPLRNGLLIRVQHHEDFEMCRLDNSRSQHGHDNDKVRE